MSGVFSMPSDTRLEYSRGAKDPNPFRDRPSGSEWGRPHVEWLNIRFEWNCESDELFTKKSKFEEAATIVQYLQSNLDMPWSRVIATEHVKGSLYDRLSDLARVVATMPEYEHEPVPPSSSPQRSSQSDVSTSPHGKVVPRPVSGASSPNLLGSLPTEVPLASTNSSSQDSEPLSEQPPSDDDATVEPEPSLPSATSRKDSDGLSPETRLEKDVEYAATAFLFVMINAFESTKADITPDEHREQDFSTLYASPHGLEIEIDNVKMASHPDLAAGLVAHRTTTDVVVEAKRLKHRRTENNLFGQQVSELLGATLKHRYEFRSKPEVEKPKEIVAYLISWHFLECYISRMKVTEKYLKMLATDSSRLGTCTRPVVRRSRTFDMRDADQRIEFAIMVARAGIELLYQYPKHRGNGTGLVRRFRGVTPFKIES